MSPPLILQAGLIAIEAAAASVALPLAAVLAVRLAPRSAARRHLIWTTSLALLAILPAMASALPSLNLLRLSTTVTAPATAAPVGPTGPGWLSLTLLAAVALWAAGVVVLLMTRLASVAALDRLRRRAQPAEPVQGVELRFSPVCDGPMTWGLLRPVVMLPAEACDWPADRRQAVLAHELAHVSRRDSLTQALAEAACALYWPNPLVWLAAKAQRREAEMAADDAVIASGVRPSDYAELLVGLARQWRGGPTAIMAMAEPSALSQRVQSILSPLPLRNGASPMDIVKLAGLGALAAGTLLAVRPSLAETAAAAPTSAAPAVSARALAPVAPVATKAEPAKPAPKARHHQISIHGDKVFVDGEARALTPEEKADLDRQLAEIGPTVAKAIADAHIGETVARNVAAHQADLGRRLAEISPRVEKALADAKIDEKIAQRIAEIQPRIDAAIARANTRAAEAAKRAEDAAAKAGGQNP